MNCLRDSLHLSTLRNGYMEAKADIKYKICRMLVKILLSNKQSVRILVRKADS